MICVRARRTEAKHLPTEPDVPSEILTSAAPFSTGGLWVHSDAICTNLRRRQECDFFTSADFFFSPSEELL